MEEIQDPSLPVSPRTSPGIPVSLSSLPPTSSTQDSIPKLGDFSKLHLPSLSTSHTPSDSSQAGDFAKLGNFGNLFSRLTSSLPPITPPSSLSSQDTDTAEMAGLAYASALKTQHPQDVVKPKVILRRPNASPPTQPLDILDSFNGMKLKDIPFGVDASGSDTDRSTTSTTSSTTPPTNPDNAQKSPVKCIKARANANASESSGTDNSAGQKALEACLVYQKPRSRPRSIQPAVPRSKEQKHESLCEGLIPLRAQDRVVARQYPGAAGNGVHVFVDYSNISISFVDSLKARLKLDKGDRFLPIPDINLEFLTELMVRGRPIKVLNAGCSVHPHRPSPSFVNEFKALGYRADVRQRKLLEQATAPFIRPGGYSSDENHATAKPRYVEDLVDETLQTRIGESVMEYFQQPGTLIIATGDAKPAQYSDGFFVYAERALNMGWHVEVVSWKSSLSSMWKGTEFRAKWGDKFRLIELDPFLDDLLACYKA